MEVYPLRVKSYAAGLQPVFGAVAGRAVRSYTPGRMIRRFEGDSYRGDQFWLFRQDDHARLAAELARQVGNAQFASPDPRQSVLLGIAEHDAGWPIHDDEPIRSSAKLPLDFLETPRPLAHKIWLTSARRATEIDPYGGLLVSLHVLALSAMSVSPNQPARFDIQQMRQQFDLNKFQHAVIEHLEALRGKLGLRIDRPLRLGLSEGWTDEAEEQLKFNFRLLQAMDGLSLAICCNNPPSNATSPFHTRPSASMVSLQLHRPSRDLLLVKPWPFATRQVEVSVPFRAIPARPYETDADLRTVFAAAPVQQLAVTLRPS